jgi:hypothetical protein
MPSAKFVVQVAVIALVTQLAVAALHARQAGGGPQVRVG